MWTADKLRLSCVKCGKEYPWSFEIQCHDCNQALVDVDYNLANVRIKDEGPPCDRFFDLMPLTSREFIVDGGEGNTPCIHAKELGRALGLNKLYMKLECTNPTKTTKDHQGALTVGVFRNLGIKSFVTSSTGNSCTGLARCVSRFPDMKMSIFVGDEFLQRVNWIADNVKIYWLRTGTFVDAHLAARWFALKTGDLPERGFFSYAKREALKIPYLESVYQVPEPIQWFVQGVSSAMAVYGTFKGAMQFKELGLIDQIPRLVCAQEETCNPMVRSWERGMATIHPDDVIEHPTGLSKATLRGNPTATYPYVHDVVSRSGGTMVTAKQDEMRELRKLVLELEGVDMCYTSSMTLAAARTLRRQGKMGADDVVLLCITGADRVGAKYPEPDYYVDRDGDDWKLTPAKGVGASDPVFDRVSQVLAASAKLPENARLENETKLVGGGLGLDSVALLEFSLALEKEFGIEIGESDLTPENFQTLGTVSALIKRTTTRPVGVGGN